MIERAIFLLSATALIGVLTSYVFYRSWKIIFLGKKDETKRKNLVKRSLVVLKYGVGQAGLLKSPAGIGHVIFAYGFATLSIISLEIFTREILHAFFGVDNFSLKFLGPAYNLLVLSEEILTWLIIPAFFASIFRLWILKPIRLEGKEKLKIDMTIILFAVFIHVIFAILLKSIEAHEGTFENPSYIPISAFIGDLLWKNNSHITIWENIAWWGHALSIFLFIFYVFGSQLLITKTYPSKHFHVISAWFNLFFSNVSGVNKLSTIDFTDESLETYGVSKLEDFRWPQLLDVISCTGCGRCQELCPAYLNDQPLSPKSLILDIRDHAIQVNGNGKKEEEMNVSLIGDVISKDTLWACTTCNACQTACPVLIEHIDKIVDMRRSLVMMDADFPQEVALLFQQLERNFNPWGYSNDTRADWATDLGVPLVEQNPTAEILYWVGCAGSFDERNKKIATSLVRILQHAGVNFAILGPEEKCTGDPARRLGNEYLAYTLIEENVKTLEKYSVKKVISTCPHCFNTLKNEYPDFGGNYEVVHAVEYVRDLMSSGKIKIQSEDVVNNITYHDSCYLGRHNGIYDAPRDILNNFESVEVKEMSMCKEKAMCCGAGGGRIWYETGKGKEVNQTRASMADETGGDTLAVSCPFCMIMLKDGLKHNKSNMNIKDLIEIVAANLSE